MRCPGHQLLETITRVRSIMHSLHFMANAYCARMPSVRISYQGRVVHIAASVGEPYRVHDLRHTHAAWLIANGEHAKTIQNSAMPR